MLAQEFEIIGSSHLIISEARSVPLFLLLGPWGCPRWGGSAIDLPSLSCPARSPQTPKEAKTAPNQKEVEAFVL